MNRQEYQKGYRNKNPLKFKLNKFKGGVKGKDSQLTVDNLIKKFGPKPKCYLSGANINLDKPETYQLDHIDGPGATLGNCGLVCSNISRAKGTTTKDEFITLCNAVSAYNEVPDYDSDF